MAKKKNTESTLDVKFTVPSFRYKGTEYKSAEVEKAAEEGDEDALELIAKLVKMGSGIVSVADEVEEDSEELTRVKEQKAPKEKKPKEEKAPKEKKPKEEKAPKEKKPKEEKPEGGE